jgi:hypothetical protein
MVSRATCFSVTFTGLDPTESYFPSVSHDAAGAFVALQPISAKPRAEDSANATDIKNESTPVSGQ